MAKGKKSTKSTEFPDLKRLAREWAKDIAQRANSASKPSHISVSARAYTTGKNVEIKVSAKSPQGDARAYEYGSGIHSRLPNKSPNQQGSRGYITIAPKRAKLLAFQWQLMDNVMEEFGYEEWAERLKYSHKFVGMSEDGRYLFKYVDHPGVEAANGGKGYIGPAVADVRRRMRKEIPKVIKKDVTVDVTRIFKIKK